SGGLADALLWRLDFRGLALGFCGLGLAGLGALVGLGGLLRRLGCGRLGPRRLLGTALFVFLFVLVDRRQRRLVGPHDVRRFAGARQARRLLGPLLCRCARRFLGTFLRTILALLGVLGLAARIGRAIGDKIG